MIDPIISVNWFDRAHGLPEHWAEQRRFLDRHHHLITPIAYQPAARLHLARVLLVVQWDRQTKPAGVAT